MLVVLLWTVVTIGVVILGTYFVHGMWRAWGAWRISQAGPRQIDAITHVLWRDPGDVDQLDLASGPGGADARPVPPFRFLEEHFGGSNPCVAVSDARGRRWRVKWGNEVRSETFAIRLVWACGYFAEVTHFVREGRIDGATSLQRAASCIDEECRFTDARFELEDPAVATHFEEHSWSWDDNPFVGSRELQGLKVLVMLLSNWDAKDRRDVARGSNTAIFEQPVRGGGREARYLITDWGGSMGAWGSNIITRGRWDPESFKAQTPQFVTGVADDLVQFGYAGQRTGDVAAGITIDGVQWLLRYLGRVTDTQLAEALAASGADDGEREIFCRALRARVLQLQQAAAAQLPVAAPSPRS